ncbi:MAG: hypothetical protein WC861_00710 [Candidatus Micrarchaeia archaeon]
MMMETTKKASSTLQKLERRGKKIESLPPIRQYLAKCAIAKESGAPRWEAEGYAVLAIDEATNAVNCGRKIEARLPMVPIRDIVYWRSYPDSISNGLAKKETIALANDIVRYDFFNHPIVSLVRRKLAITKGIAGEFFKALWEGLETSSKTGNLNHEVGE